MLMSVPFTSGRCAVSKEIFHKKQAGQHHCEPGPELVTAQSFVGNPSARPAARVHNRLRQLEANRPANSAGVHRSVSDSSGSVFTT